MARILFFSMAQERLAVHYMGSIFDASWFMILACVFRVFFVPLVRVARMRLASSGTLLKSASKNCHSTRAGQRLISPQGRSRLARSEDEGMAHAALDDVVRMKCCRAQGDVPLLPHC